MNNHENTSGWFKLTLLWVASFIPDTLANASAAQWLTYSMLILTLLQIVKTLKGILYVDNQNS